MNTNSQIFLKLIQEALYEKPNMFPADTTIDWQNVYTETKHQTVVCLLAPLLNTMKYTIPEPIKEVFSEDVGKNVISFHRHLHYQNEAIEALQRQNVPVVVLKGCVAAANYPFPEYRTPGDIDLFIPVESFETARDCLLRQNYKLASGETGELSSIAKQKHLALQKDDILLELHVSPFLIPDTQLDAILNNYMYRGFNNIQFLSLEGYEIPTLPVLQNALEFLIHIQGHLCGMGIGLRQILDWSFFVEKQLSADIYEQQLLPILRKSGLETFANVLTRMCQLHLGLPEDLAPWCLNANAKTCEQLLNFILLQGNFGKKNANDNGARALSRLGHPVHFFKEIQFVGLKNFPNFSNNKILKHFAWIPQTGRYLKYVFQNKSTLNHDIREGKQRRLLFESLKLFEK